MSRLARLIPTAPAISGWILFAIRALQSVLFYALGPARDSVYLYDWRVYSAGALDLIQRSLYLDGGIAVGTLKMPVDVFNYPPMAAVLPMPLLPLGYQLGGLAWVIAGMAALAASAFLAARIVRLPMALAWVGLLLLWYTFQPHFTRAMVLGNENSFVLLLVVGFAWAHLRGHQRAAGLLLGLAVAIKLWPLLIGVLLVRERRWREMAWAGGLLAVQGVAFLVWLGPSFVPAMLDALRTSVPIPEGVLVLWTSAARETFSWWPAWGSLAVAGVLLAIPARGRLGLGLAIVAGLSVIANLWDHYLPTFAFAGLLMIGSDEARRLFDRLFVSGPVHADQQVGQVVGE